MLTPLVRIVLIALVSLTTQSAYAQNFPVKPIRLVVASSAGSGGDFLGRIIGQKLTDAWHQPVIVDPRPGAGSVLATEFVRQSPPDGHTLVIVPTSYSLNPTLYSKLPYDTLKDLARVTLVGTQPNLLVSHPSVPVKSVKDIIVLAKTKPGHLNYASSGVGSGGFLAAEMFKSMARIAMTHIPYKGPGPALSDLLGGQVDMLFTSPLAAMPFVKTGRLRALAVTSAERVATLPDIPTVAETGVPGYEVLVWNGIVVPAATPAPVIQKISTEFIRILQLVDVKERLANLGFSAQGSTPEEFDKFVRAEMLKWGKVMTEAGIKPQ